MKRVRIIVSPDGKAKVENIWGYGAQCTDLSAVLEKALGQADESTREKTPEYDVETQANQSLGL